MRTDAKRITRIELRSILQRHAHTARPHEGARRNAKQRLGMGNRGASCLKALPMLAIVALAGIALFVRPVAAQSQADAGTTLRILSSGHENAVRPVSYGGYPAENEAAISVVIPANNVSMSPASNGQNERRQPVGFRPRFDSPPASGSWTSRQSPWRPISEASTNESQPHGERIPREATPRRTEMHFGTHEAGQSSTPSASAAPTELRIRCPQWNDRPPVPEYKVECRVDDGSDHVANYTTAPTCLQPVEAKPTSVNILFSPGKEDPSVELAVRRVDDFQEVDRDCPGPHLGVRCAPAQVVGTLDLLAQDMGGQSVQVSFLREVSNAPKWLRKPRRGASQRLEGPTLGSPAKRRIAATSASHAQDSSHLGPFAVSDSLLSLEIEQQCSRLLCSPDDLKEVVVVDSNICEVVQNKPREVLLRGKTAGTTHVTFRFEDPAHEPFDCLIHVTAAGRD